MDVPLLVAGLEEIRPEARFPGTFGLGRKKATAGREPTGTLFR